MKTASQIHYTNASSMKDVDDDSIQLIVTSPPYPMIEMWDAQFATLDSSIANALEGGNGRLAFRKMHNVLKDVWEECYRVLQPGGIACINIGDATRKIGGDFQMFPNHAQVVQDVVEIGFTQLPDILWRKPTNSAAKFMGSGMLGLNAYVTLEHEHILVFRKGSTRKTKGAETNYRRESAYFWEERNKWFSDVWMDLKGVRQDLKTDHQHIRKRSGAFPIELPLRLIEMYSVYEDTVLDPFCGTGTTLLAAAVAARNAIGYELEDKFKPIIASRMQLAGDISQKRNQERLQAHAEFVEQRKKEGNPPLHENEVYRFSVTSGQEKKIRLYDVTHVWGGENACIFGHEPHPAQTELFADTV
jgi:DNA modification methylase